ncbi:MAG: ATP-binding protein [Planctomycetota bacterium]
MGRASRQKPGIGARRDSAICILWLAAVDLSDHITEIRSAGGCQTFLEPPIRELPVESDLTVPRGHDYDLPNPFSTEFTSPSKVKYRFNSGAAGKNPQHLARHLETLLGKLKDGKRGLIVGPHGTGKSTLLHTFLPKLQQTFPRVAFHQLSRDPRASWLRRVREGRLLGKRLLKRTFDLPGGSLVVIDGWEQVGRITRFRLNRAVSSRKLLVLATSHRRFSGWTVVHETSTSQKMVSSLAEDLLTDCPYDLRKEITTEIKRMPIKNSTNIRELWFTMYDRVQQSQNRTS